MRQLTTMALPKAWAAELSADRSANVPPPETQMAAKMVEILGSGWHLAPARRPGTGSARWLRPAGPGASHERGGGRRGSRRGGFRDVA